MRVASYPPAPSSLTDAKVAYFSMEIHIEDDIPTYGGGLGVLAGDTLRAAADLGLPMVGVTLAHRQGYVRQALDGDGRQIESPSPWAPEQRLTELAPRISVSFLTMRLAWRG